MLIYRYLFNRDDFPRTQPSPRVTSIRGRKRKAKTCLPAAGANETLRQLRLFIQTANGIVPAFSYTPGPKRPGRKPKPKLPKHRKPAKPRTKSSKQLERLATVPQYDQLSKAQIAKLDAAYQDEIELRKAEVQASWSREIREDRSMHKVEPVEFSPLDIED